jgi:hypothetical protein
VIDSCAATLTDTTPPTLPPPPHPRAQINLAHSTSQTLPFENLQQIRTLCLCPDGALLLSIDEAGRALVIHRQRRVLLHHVSFKAAARAAKFSPDGKMVAVAVGKLLQVGSCCVRFCCAAARVGRVVCVVRLQMYRWQSWEAQFRVRSSKTLLTPTHLPPPATHPARPQVWHTPSTAKSMAPMQLHRTYGGCHDDVTCLDWSECGQFIAVGSKDLTVSRAAGWLVVWCMSTCETTAGVQTVASGEDCKLINSTSSTRPTPTLNPRQARVFSLNPIPGYAPATLAGHKEGLTGIFFTADTTRAAAALAGQPPTHLYTVARDGALFGWHFAAQAGGGGAAAAVSAPAVGGARAGRKAAVAGRGEEEQEEEEEESSSSGDEESDEESSEEEAAEAAAPAFASGAWSVGFKHYFMQRGAKLTCVDFHRCASVFFASRISLFALGRILPPLQPIHCPPTPTPTPTASTQPPQQNRRPGRRLLPRNLRDAAAARGRLHPHALRLKGATDLGRVQSERRLAGARLRAARAAAGVGVAERDVCAEAAGGR